jgi:glyoxylase-like metal-dependent hydrolase (beta-lactamase superfamily II)
MASERLPLKTRAVLAFGLLAFLSACGRGDVTETPSDASLKPPPLKLYVFDCGHIHDLGLSLTSELSEIFVPCYLIEHPDGRLIWDAGVPANVADSPDRVEIEAHPLGVAQMDTTTFFVTLDRTLADQLGELGLGSSDIDLIALSHLHFDHVAQAGQFSEATHLIQRAEHEAAFVEMPTVPFFEPQYYADLEDNETVLLDGDHDVFGDGRVVIKSTPGHTPGHQCLYLDLAATGRIVLSGDLYHSPERRRLRDVPQINFDREQTLASMDRLEAFLKEKGAELWIEHDLAFAQGLRKSPGFYE